VRWCGSCASTLRAAPPSSVAGIPLLAAARLEGPWQRAIHTFKYRGRPQLAETLAGPLVEAIADRLPRLTGLAYIPLHPTRLKERGFNQAERLASTLGRRLALPLLDDLRRVRATSQQVGLAEAERRQNVAGAFAWAGPRPPAGLGLVDDVCTTGATLTAAARAIQEAGGRVEAMLVLGLASPQTLPGPAVTFPE
jgi:ComF family protein